jgi:hypothetical protein
MILKTLEQPQLDIKYISENESIVSKLLEFEEQATAIVSFLAYRIFIVAPVFGF